MKAAELKRWLRKRGCTFESKRRGSGHLIVHRLGRRSQLPMHGADKELSTGVVAKIKKDLGLDDEKRTRRPRRSTAARFGRGEHGMLGYTVNLIDEDDGTVLVTSRDFPELTTFGADRAAALAHAVGAFEEAIASRIHARMDVPPPTPTADDCVYLATLTVAKVMLYRGMRDAQVSKSELARRLNWHFPQVERVLDLNHRSRLDQIDAALAAVGLRLDVVGVAETDSPAAVATGGAETPYV